MTSTDVTAGGGSPAPLAERGVSAERLLEHVGTAPPTRFDRVASSAARRMVHQLLRRMTNDELTVHEPAGTADTSTSDTNTYGRPGTLHARVTVHDPRAYLALVREGSAGLGRGYVERWWSSPDPLAVVQVIIRNLGGMDRLRNRLRRVTGGLGDRVRDALPRDTRRRNKDDIGAHYDIGNAFFELFLDETMTYSSGVFRTPGDSLADASRNKYDLLLAKLGVTADHQLLEIGTGWGGLAIRAADTIGCAVTTTTISDEQLVEARRRVRAAGHGERVTLLGTDWRDLTGRHDRLVSIEMIEAVDWRDYERFFGAVERLLVPDGLAALQAICVPDARWQRSKNTVDFIKRFVFPNGNLPSVEAMCRAASRATKLAVVDVEDFGMHYVETLRRWRERFEARLDDVRALGLDDRFVRLWRFYLVYCEAAFRERHCTVVQLVFAGPAWRAPAVQ